MADRVWGVFYCAGEKVESMDDVLGELVVHKLNGVRKKECFRGGFGYMEAAVVIECWPYAEAFVAAEVPRFSSGRLVVDDDWKPHVTDGCGI